MEMIVGGELEGLEWVEALIAFCNQGASLFIFGKRRKSEQKRVP